MAYPSTLSLKATGSDNVRSVPFLVEGDYETLSNQYNNFALITVINILLDVNKLQQWEVTHPNTMGPHVETRGWDQTLFK